MEQILLSLIEKMRHKANMKAESAAYGGAWDDGGASVIKDQCTIFEAGLRGECPDLKSWKTTLLELRKETDPEYEEYLRLKAKFDDI